MRSLPVLLVVVLSLGKIILIRAVKREIKIFIISITCVKYDIIISCKQIPLQAIPSLQD